MYLKNYNSTDSNYCYCRDGEYYYFDGKYYYHNRDYYNLDGNYYHNKIIVTNIPRIVTVKKVC